MYDRAGRGLQYFSFNLSYRGEAEPEPPGTELMNNTGKVLVSLIFAAIAATLASFLLGGELFNPTLAVIFMVTTLATAFVVAPPRFDHSGASPSASPGGSNSVEGEREDGTGKWFNVTKGFGFIVRENGEEIFVHFRSIQGEGRRGLRDGQAVRFVVAQTDKGPQAEDVEPL